MRLGPVRRCASYCTWSSRSRTTVLESGDDQWRIPVTRGNFDSSCGLAGALPDSDTSEAGLVSAVFWFGAVAGPCGAVLASIPDDDAGAGCAVDSSDVPFC